MKHFDVFSVHSTFSFQFRASFSYVVVCLAVSAFGVCIGVYAIESAEADGIVAIGKSSNSSIALKSSFLSRCTTISLYIPLSNLAMFSNLVSFGGSLANSRLSIYMFCNFTKRFQSTLVWFYRKYGQVHGIGVNNQSMPPVFFCGWRFGLDIISSVMTVNAWRLILFSFRNILRAFVLPVFENRQYSSVRSKQVAF